ncbi:hypothetical protein P152DRAFT_139808 [Eremomyces bilateralis CBS 781.70]|uniref:Uncharacterized protein n=1 Tax=Eremomyces bilateralis CBS 781.70 TaxID=1392243 RepID=A0A6G1FWU2_9PEZI|nr:uncharacterized protein P152DRAFT_139808 [Eremomyces bilateralis CBS 781.70]KAF1810099.1 hypothetical protein P152DRAFT_139808 [Eremomyces bilateralis CBS 781.70]
MRQHPHDLQVAEFSRDPLQYSYSPEEINSHQERVAAREAAARPVKEANTKAKADNAYTAAGDTYSEPYVPQDAGDRRQTPRDGPVRYASLGEPGQLFPPLRPDLEVIPPDSPRQPRPRPPPPPPRPRPQPQPPNPPPPSPAKGQALPKATGPPRECEEPEEASTDDSRQPHQRPPPPLLPRPRSQPHPPNPPQSLARQGAFPEARGPPPNCELPDIPGSTQSLHDGSPKLPILRSAEAEESQIGDTTGQTVPVEVPTDAALREQVVRARRSEVASVQREEPYRDSVLYGGLNSAFDTYHQSLRLIDAPPLTPSVPSTPGSAPSPSFGTLPEDEERPLSLGQMKWSWFSQEPRTPIDATSSQGTGPNIPVQWWRSPPQVPKTPSYASSSQRGKTSSDATRSQGKTPARKRTRLTLPFLKSAADPSTQQKPWINKRSISNPIGLPNHKIKIRGEHHEIPHGSSPLTQTPRGQRPHLRASRTTTNLKESASGQPMPFSLQNNLRRTRTSEALRGAEPPQSSQPWPSNPVPPPPPAQLRRVVTEPEVPVPLEPSRPVEFSEKLLEAIDQVIRQRELKMTQDFRRGLTQSTENAIAKFIENWEQQHAGENQPGLPASQRSIEPHPEVEGIHITPDFGESPRLLRPVSSIGLNRPVPRPASPISLNQPAHRLAHYAHQSFLPHPSLANGQDLDGGRDIRPALRIATAPQSFNPGFASGTSVPSSSQNRGPPPASLPYDPLYDEEREYFPVQSPIPRHCAAIHRAGGHGFTFDQLYDEDQESAVPAPLPSPFAANPATGTRALSDPQYDGEDWDGPEELSLDLTRGSPVRRPRFVVEQPDEYRSPTPIDRERTPRPSIAQQRAFAQVEPATPSHPLETASTTPLGSPFAPRQYEFDSSSDSESEGEKTPRASQQNLRPSGIQEMPPFDPEAADIPRPLTISRGESESPTWYRSVAPPSDQSELSIPRNRGVVQRDPQPQPYTAVHDNSAPSGSETPIPFLLRGVGSSPKEPPPQSDTRVHGNISPSGIQSPSRVPGRFSATPRNEQPRSANLAQHREAIQPSSDESRGAYEPWFKPFTDIPALSDRFHPRTDTERKIWEDVDREIIERQVRTDPTARGSPRTRMSFWRGEGVPAPESPATNSGGRDETLAKLEGRWVESTGSIIPRYVFTPQSPAANISPPAIPRLGRLGLAPKQNVATGANVGGGQNACPGQNVSPSQIPRRIIPSVRGTPSTPTVPGAYPVSDPRAAVLAWAEKHRTPDHKFTPRGPVAPVTPSAQADTPTPQVRDQIPRYSSFFSGPPPELPQSPLQVSNIVGPTIIHPRLGTQSGQNALSVPSVSGSREEDQPKQAQECGLTAQREGPESRAEDIHDQHLRHRDVRHQHGETHLGRSEGQSRESDLPGRIVDGMVHPAFRRQGPGPISNEEFYEIMNLRFQETMRAHQMSAQVPSAVRGQGATLRREETCQEDCEVEDHDSEYDERPLLSRGSQYWEQRKKRKEEGARDTEVEASP